MKTLNDWRRAQSQAASMTSRLVSQDARVVQTIPSLPARANLFNRIAHPSINGLGAGVPAGFAPQPGVTPISPKSMIFLQRRIRFLSSLIDETDRILSYMNDQIAVNTEQMNYFNDLISASRVTQGINITYTDGIINSNIRLNAIPTLINNVSSALMGFKSNLIQQKQAIEADIARSNQLSSQNRT